MPNEVYGTDMTHALYDVCTCRTKGTCDLFYSESVVIAKHVSARVNRKQGAIVATFINQNIIFLLLIFMNQF